MKPEIKYQKNLMLYALSLLEHIEAMEDGPFDQPENKKEAEVKYAETMAELAGELCKLSKVKVIIHEEISY